MLNGAHLNQIFHIFKMLIGDDIKYNMRGVSLIYTETD